MNKLVLNAPLRHKVDSFAPIKCVVERIITIPQRAFDQRREHPRQDSSYIADTKQYMWNEGDTAHCVLYLGDDTDDGILVQSEGHDFAGLSQYIPNAKNLAFAAECGSLEKHIHESLMKMADEAAKQCHNGETSLNFCDLADKMGLDFEETLRRALVEILRNREDMEMAAYLPLIVDFQPDIVMKPKPLQTMLLISPLCIVTVPEDYSDHEEIMR